MGTAGFEDVHKAAPCQDSAFSQHFHYCTKAIRSILIPVSSNIVQMFG